MSNSAEARAREIKRLAWLLDDAIRLPGGYRVGVDGIIGLVPGIGDAVGLAASTYILLRARRFGLPGSVMARMAGNVLLELVVGAVPVAGDLFDFVFKANRRNVALMEKYFADAPRTRRRSRAAVVATAVLAGVVIVAAFYGAVTLLQWLWNLAQG